MHAAATQSSDFGEPSSSAPSLVVGTFAQTPALAVGDESDEAAILTLFSPPVAAASAHNAVELRAEDSGTRTFVEAVVPVHESASACAAHDATRSRVDTRVPFLVYTEGTEVILGDASQDFTPSPLLSSTVIHPQRSAEKHSTDATSAEERQVDGDDDVDVARGNAIQDKYNNTEERLERLPPCDSSDLLDCPKYASGSSEKTSLGAAKATKRRRLGEGSVKDGPAKGVGGERKRRAQEKAQATELQTAFRHSQRALRRQAKLVSMKDVFSRTLSLPSPLQIVSDAVGSSLSFSSGASPVDAGINYSDSNADPVVPATTGVSSPASLRCRPHAFSPTSLVSPSSPSNGTAWSPDLVGELTNRFLAHVQQQKRQRFEQMVSRELSQSQVQSQTRSLRQHLHQCGGAEDDKGDDYREGDPRLRKDSAAANRFAAPVEELVIGEEDDETANWMPADPSSPTSQHARRMVQRDAASNDEVALLGACTSQEGRFPSFSTAPLEGRKAEEEEEAKASQEQEQVVRSLARKHEIWKLKQRQMRAQAQVDLDERAREIQQKRSSKPVAAVTSSSSPSVPVRLARDDAELASATSSMATGAMSAPFFTSLFRPYEAATAGVCQSGHDGSNSTPMAARSIQSAKLSAEDISMIRRINSFDNTSTQRVVVFGTAASKQHKDENARR
ncbi:hypothetical protein LSCM1_01023 [Leishmania martiniquensis]|uniref:Uncharacterized protein n=1 Tax=Leishmania martiniquensis TaxID=1580590 RepID=A0A836G2V1_9TRYP|nr:hypothetical protein LSCM1_01023 [Leishmania martiniquensis]